MIQNEIQNDDNTKSERTSDLRRVEEVLNTWDDSAAVLHFGRLQRTNFDRCSFGGRRSGAHVSVPEMCLGKIGN